MEIVSINSHHDFDLPINNDYDTDPSSHTNKTFVVAANGISNHKSCINITVSDIEMIAIQAAAAYTSLKDLLPTSPSTTMSPTNSRKDSWREIPIKDPLLQHAAWAYLQPMAVDHEAHNRTFVQKFKDQFCGVFGCFNDVVRVLVKSLFPFSRREEHLHLHLHQHQHQHQHHLNGEKDKFD